MSFLGRTCRAALAACVLVGLPAPAGTAAPDAKVPDDPARREWPQFHGPNRDNRSADTHLMKRWPHGGPKLLWRVSGIGHGYSNVTISGGMIYTTGNIAKDTVITALDMGGKVLWRAKNGPAYLRSQRGTRSVPTIVGGRLYHLNADGDLVCLDAKTARKIWSLNILKKFNGRNISWALAESVLVDGQNVICCPGGEKVSMVALDKDTGKTVWACEGVGDKPGYASPILVEYKGLRQIVTLMSASVIGVHAKTGKLLWKFDQPAKFDENILRPVYHDGHVFTCTGHGRGGSLVKLIVNGQECSVRRIWHSGDLDNQHGGVVLVDGYLYGKAHRGRNTRWVCVEFKTGRTTYAAEGPPGGSGSLTYADGMLYLLSDRGTAALVPADPKAFRIVSKFDLPKGGRGPAWAHPVVCGGRLYLRHGNFLHAYDVRGK